MNGHVERSIQTIMSIARAMMIHSVIHWSDVADTSLWPMAVNYAFFLWNHLPQLHNGLSPSDLFTKIRYPLQKLHDCFVWGSPAYVLDKRISDGGKIPRWKPRSSRAMHLGRAENYASSIPLVLNLDTGSITPQFHIVVDNWFATVASSVDSLPEFNSDDWEKMFGDSTLQYVLDAADLEQMQELTDAMEDAVATDNVQAAKDRVLDAMTRIPSSPPPFLADTSTGARASREDLNVTTIAPASFPNPGPIPSATPNPITNPTPPAVAVPTVAPTQAPVYPQDPPPVPTVPSSVPSPSPGHQAPRRSTRPRAGRQLLDPGFEGKSYSSKQVNLAHASHFHELFIAIHCSYHSHHSLVGSLPGSSHGISPSSDPDRVTEEGAIMAAKKSQDPDTLSFD